MNFSTSNNALNKDWDSSNVIVVKNEFMTARQTVDLDITQNQEFMGKLIEYIINELCKKYRKYM